MDVEVAVVHVDVPAEDVDQEVEHGREVDELDELGIEAGEAQQVERRPVPASVPDPIDRGDETLEALRVQHLLEDREAVALEPEPGSHHDSCTSSACAAVP